MQNPTSTHTRNQKIVLSIASMLVVLAFVISGIGGASGIVMKRSDPTERSLSHSEQEASAAGGTVENPLDESDEWVSGNWTMDREGMDPTILFDPATYDEGPHVKEPAPQAARDAADRFIEYQKGYGKLDSTMDVKTRKTSVTSHTALISQIEYTPGAGWITAIRRDPGDGQPTKVPIGSIQPVDGEYLDYRITGIADKDIADLEDRTCPSTIDDDPENQGWVSLFNATDETRDVYAVLYAIPTWREINSADHVGEADAYRNEVVTIKVYGTGYKTHKCDYHVEVQWNLTYAFEAFIEPPTDSDPTSPDVTNIPPYQNEEQFRNETHVMRIGNYTYPATLEFETGSASFVYTKPDLIVDPIDLTMLYAPVVPIEWACDSIGVMDDCVSLLLQQTSSSTYGIYVFEATDVTGTIIAAVENFDGIGLASTHIVDPNSRFDIGLSTIYELLPDGTVDENPYTG